MAITLKSLRNIFRGSANTNQKESYNTSTTTNEGFKSTSGEPWANQTGTIWTTNYQIPETPFRMVGNQQQGYMITMGKYQMTLPKKTELQALNEMEEKRWQIIANMIISMPGCILDSQGPEKPSSETKEN